ncbi:helicase protein with RING/U-box domain-containing protein [Artemisia annua]|uniref:Helicase protein with RING/U-box domain-containing protein n=1 Tax=Artemisia annua TaxID=35608 RepID=A0A2U1MMJ2_ARTAN|nr:helicase protein with RING/U-box domain-containing protein [Artemisia annua]
MQLRSRASDPLNKGKAVMEVPDSEDDEGPLSDSDYSVASVEGILNNEEVGMYVSDSESEDYEPNSRKGSSRRVRRRVQEIQERLEQVIENDHVDLDEELVVDHVDLDEELVVDHVDLDEEMVVNDYVDLFKEVPVVRRRTNKKKKKDRPTLLWEVWEEQTENWLDQHMTEDVDLDNMNEIVTETVEQPPDLIMPLLRYQKEWLAWGLKQEESPSRGGILADEMGMGKTVQAIALVLAKRALCHELGEPVEMSTGSSTGLPCVKATLVMCPLIAVMQWVNEIDKFTTKGSNKVLVYHGPGRAKHKDFSQYDFVITTYSTAESEYRKNIMPPKERCEWCGKMYHAKKMKVHLQYFCGPGAVKTMKQSKQNKKKGKLDLKLSLAKEDASDEEEDLKKASKKNTKRQRKKGKSETGGPSKTPSGSGSKSSMSSRLHSVKWTRIILDEAHYIKDRRCNTTRAVFSLESSYKWALSGTPLQNRVGELYSLVRFLQITPYSYYFCKDCDCKVLDYSPNSSCPGCPHKSVRHFCWWNKNVANPIANSGHSDEGRRAMILLKDKVLKSILLRRTKKGRAADLALPPRIISLRRDYLDITEQDYYESLYSESQAQFNTYVEAGTVMNNYAHIFDLLTRLRQAVDHPYLVVYSKSAVARRLESNEPKSTDEQFCGICHDVAEDSVVTSCEHLFCKSCLIDFSASYGEPACPTCSKPLTVDFSANKEEDNPKPKKSVKGYKADSIINRIRLENFQTSTKIDALKEEIRSMVERDGSAKGIVFSQYTSFLDLINYSLQKSGVKCVALDGSMSMSAREAAISRFTNDSECRVFLMSLKAGGVALNLTVASHVFLMDPWWNPAVEQQAQDRIHRIGQYKPIRVVRFVIENTVEERILNLQEKKKLVFEGTVGGSNEALGKLTEADMRFLFAN